LHHAPDSLTLACFVGTLSLPANYDHIILGLLYSYI